MLRANCCEMKHLPQMRLALRFSDHFSDFGVKEDGACSRASACPLVVWTMEGSVTASAPASWVGAESAAFETRALSGTVSGDRLILQIVRRRRECLVGVFITIQPTDQNFAVDHPE